MFIVINSLNFLLKRVGLVKPISGSFLSDPKGTFKKAHYFYFLDAVVDYNEGMEGCYKNAVAEGYMFH